MDYSYLQSVLGTEPTLFEKQLYDRLKKYLNREPNDSEILNMKTDTNLVMWVLAGI